MVIHQLTFLVKQYEISATVDENEFSFGDQSDFFSDAEVF
jgi:hypothetical protein